MVGPSKQVFHRADFIQVALQYQHSCVLVLNDTGRSALDEQMD